MTLLLEFIMFNLFKSCISHNHNLLNLKHKYSFVAAGNHFLTQSNCLVKYSPYDGIDKNKFLDID